MEHKLRGLNHLHKGYWYNFPKGIVNENNRIFLTAVWPTGNAYMIKYRNGHSIICRIMQTSSEIMASPAKDAMKKGWNWLRPVIVQDAAGSPPVALLGRHNTTVNYEVEPVFESKRTEKWQKDTLWLLEKDTKEVLITVMLEIDLTDKTAMTTFEVAEQFFTNEYQNCIL